MESDDYFPATLSQLSFAEPQSGDWILLGVILALLIFSGFLSAAKTAYSTLSQNDLDEIRKQKKKIDPTVLQLTDRHEHVMATTILLNTFVNIFFIILSFYLFSRWVIMPYSGVVNALIQGGFIALALLLFGEVLPKNNARYKPRTYARFTAKFLAFLEQLTRPLTSGMTRLTSLAEMAPARKRYELSVDELSKALELTETENSDEKVMLEEIIKFYNKSASEIMTSRVDVEDIDIKAEFCDVIDFIVKSGYSRIPVYEGTEDNIRGILYIKDLLPYLQGTGDIEWQSLIRPAYFVPEAKKIDNLLEEFRTNKIHMAIVVDEFGGTSGIVTMEDILEEIVGEISDEYDEDEKQYIRQPDGSIIFEAKIPLTDFFRVINANPSEFGNLTDEVETLAGLILEIKGDFPERREVINYETYRFDILEVDKRRILKIKLERLDPKEQSKEESSKAEA